MVNKELLENSAKIQDELVSIRRKIHSNPELGHKEFKTSKLISDFLESLGLEVIKNVGITGVVGILKGENPGKTLLIRADMDALPILEQNDVDYSSKNEGVMHACGHDAHVTWLLGTAKILTEFKSEIKGTIKFVFQPAEEAPNGAMSVINDGVLDNPKVDAAIAAHAWPEIESGKFGIITGPAMAAPDFFKITIKGRGGHGSQPEKCIDPILVGHEIYNALLSIPNKDIGALDPSVLTVTKFSGGNSENVIPDTMTMEGTARTLSYEARKKMPVLMEKIIAGITDIHGAEYEMEYRSNTPPLINDGIITSLLSNSIEELLGEEKVYNIEKPSMGGEDFSCYLEKVPGTMFYVGIYNEKKEAIYPIHHPKFNIDEDVLSKASAVFAKFALDYLK
ncbi:MAG: amidohydrolase [Tissierellia bacterium]|nr:amidohydrolase [Tissierellia bacterium]